MPRADLSSPPSLKYFRASVAKDKDALRVDRENRVIRGCALCSVGEARGHQLWCDQTFLEQIVAAGKKANQGVKCRFGHPGMSSDALGTAVGRFKNFSLVGEVARGDLHFLSEDNKDTLAGDKIEHIFHLAEDAPEDFGVSVVFKRDAEAELAFLDKNSSTTSRGDRIFQSPDKRNTENYRHARLGALRAADCTDAPASNPGGFFSDIDELLGHAEQLFAYLFELTEDAPAAELLGGIEPKRVKRFFGDFCQRHGVSVTSVLKVAELSTPEAISKLVAKTGLNAGGDAGRTGHQRSTQAAAPSDEEPAEKGARSMSEENKDTTQEASQANSGNADLERFNRLRKAFPDNPAFAVEMFDADKDVEEARFEHQAREIQAVKEALAANKEVEGTEAVGFGGDASTGGQQEFTAKARALAEEKKIPLYVAMSQVAKREPDLYKRVDRNYDVKQEHKRQALAGSRH